MMHPNNYTRQRHIFTVELPEELRTAETRTAQAFMDVRIYPTGNVAPQIEIDTYGVVIDKFFIEHPTWIPTDTLEAEKCNVR